ncbi:MAG: DUF115 domain-containing protein [Clostridia bacterium]|nr:DUF115 domain-containing protein [Clostridia bacterium]
MNIFLSLQSRIRGRMAKDFASSPYGKKLKKFKDIHKGERCFIIGNGPSLKAEDLETLKAHNEVTFGMNRIYKIFNETSWRPTYYCCEDVLIIKEKQAEINAIESKAKFIPVNLKWFEGVNVDGAKYFWLNYDREKDYLHSFSTDIAKQIDCRGTVTFSCMQIAAYMGFRKIYLIGVDHNYSKIIDEAGNIIEDKNAGDYFCKDYDQDIKDVAVHDMGQSTLTYRDARRFADESIGRVTIYNATRGGKLEEFERVDFDSLFEVKK